MWDREEALKVLSEPLPEAESLWQRAKPFLKEWRVALIGAAVFLLVLALIL